MAREEKKEEESVALVIAKRIDDAARATNKELLVAAKKLTKLHPRFIAAKKHNLPYGAPLAVGSKVICKDNKLLKSHGVGNGTMGW